MTLFTSWRKRLREERFGDRDELSKEELFRRFWADQDLPEEEVREVFELIEFEYGIPAGILRPDDELAKLFVPLSTWNPIAWLNYQQIFGDRHDSLDTSIAEKLKQHDLVDEWGDAIYTVDDYVRAWCGQPPESG